VPRFSIRITSRVDLDMSVCTTVRMNVEDSETIRARMLVLSTQILGLPAQRKSARFSKIFKLLSVPNKNILQSVFI